TLQVLGVDQATVALRDEETNEVELCAGRGENVRALGMRVPLGAGLNGRVVATNRPLRIGDVQADPRTWRPEQARDEGLRSWLGVPLADETGVFGVLATLSGQPNAFTEE